MPADSVRQVCDYPLTYSTEPYTEIGRVVAERRHIFFFVFYVFECLPACTYRHHVHAVPAEDRRGRWLPWKWGYIVGTENKIILTAGLSPAPDDSCFYLTGISGRIGHVWRCSCTCDVLCWSCVYKVRSTFWVPCWAHQRPQFSQACAIYVEKKFLCSP